MDGFYEHIVRKTKTAKDGMYTAAIVLGALLVVFYIAPIIGSLVNIMFVSALLQVLSVYAVYYLMTAQNIEYEYILTNHELDIDMIAAKRKRKRMLSVDCKDFEILAPVNSGDHIDAYKQIKTLNYAGNKMSRSCYFAVYEKSGEKVCLLFEPTEAMLRALRNYIPGKVIIDETI